ncbi:Uncharacterized conserved protein YeaO, DUF488 family [Halomonas shengliensis]|uniref:Uncharacterized conserved protein YeaO, DUF488 family n=1 Tax=Halomonas shengliensis TaxID=419597 RepID=A0A1H0IRI0_9GAMM|nr:DUF488 family protein [Halomonas shengliensis]SDO33995.1 Uncharacterized conserved protein YeaO, DUF488 family [Halomonas shengliensis]
MSYRIAIKAIGQPPEPEDGSRVLVDRLWPRGRSREALALDDWYRDASPSPTLHRQLRQGEISAGVFTVRYRGELRDHPERLVPLMRLVRRGPLTLLTAARDPAASPLPILRERLLFALREEDAADLEPASPPCFVHELRDDPDA